jgi:hypothetical protein
LGKQQVISLVYDSDSTVLVILRPYHRLKDTRCLFHPSAPIVVDGHHGADCTCYWINSLCSIVPASLGIFLAGTMLDIQDDAKHRSTDQHRCKEHAPNKGILDGFPLVSRNDKHAAALTIYL